MAYQPKSYRKFIATGVATAMVATAVAPAVSANFPDVDQDLWHAEYINFAFERGFIEGDPSGDFRPFANMNRAEAVTVVLRMLGENPNELEDVTTTTFPDTTGDQWWSPAIERAVELGVVQGKADGNFHPRANLTRAEFAEMLFNAFDIEADEDNMVEFDDLVEDDWYEEAIMALASNGIIEGDGDGTFRPNDDVQRNESAAMVQRTILLIEGEDEDEDPSEVEGLVLENVSSINGQRFDMTVSFNDPDVESDDLEGTTITLDGPAGELTASFQEMDNGAAVYEVDNTDALTPGDGSADGTYEVTSNSFDVAEGVVTTYSEILTANVIEGFVYAMSLVDDDDIDSSLTTPDDMFSKTLGRVENATVSVGGRTVQTDARGYYAVPANPGLRTVEVSAPGHYTQNANVTVDRNFASAQNFDMVEYDRRNLHITGIAADSETTESIENATVSLQVYEDGEWVEIADQTTAGDGLFAFHNNEIDPTVVADEFTGLVDPSTGLEGDDRLDIEKEYRVVISKSVTDYLYDNYETYTSETFELSESSPATSYGMAEVRQISELEELNFNIEWSAQADFTTTDNLHLELLHTNGRTVLGEAQEISGDNFDVDEETRQLSDSVDLAASGFYRESGTSLRLPDGTYFFRVVDRAGFDINNAIAIATVEVEEGTAVDVDITRIRPSSNANLESSVSGITYSDVDDAFANAAPTTLDTITLANGDITIGSNREIKSEVEVRQVVGDVEVVVYPDFIDLDPQYFEVKGNETDGVTSIEAPSLRLPYLGAVAGREYVGSSTNSWLSSDSFALRVSNSFAQSTAQFNSAATLSDVELAFTDSEENALDREDYEESKVNSIRLENEDGTTVKEYAPRNKAVEDIVNADNKITDEDFFDEFEQIDPGDYKLVLDIEGFDVKTTSLIRFHDFQKVDAGTVTLEEIPDTTISGVLRYTDNSQRVQSDDEISVALYNDEGQLTAAVDMEDSSVYNLVNGDGNVIDIGEEYTMVVRGPGIETYSTTVEIEDRKTQLNLSVDRGGQATAEFALRDSNGFPVEDGAHRIRDEYFSTSNINDTVAGNAEYLGSYNLDQETSIASGGYRVTGLSAGNFTLDVRETDRSFADSLDFRIQSPNDSFYRVVTVDAKSDEPQVPLTVDFTDRDRNINYVTVVDEAGNVVDHKRDIALKYGKVTMSVPQNGSYTVNVYSNGHFVGSQSITIQDFARTITVGRTAFTER